MNKGCLLFALQSLITKCHLTSWDIHCKGKTTLILRWDSDNTAAIDRPDQSELVSFARYHKKSPSELRRDTHCTMTRHQLLAQGQSVKTSKDNIYSTQMLTQTLLWLKAQLYSQNPPSTIDNHSSDSSKKKYSKNM